MGEPHRRKHQNIAPIVILKTNPSITKNK